MKGSRTAYRLVVEKPDVNRSLEGPQIRSEDNIEIDVAVRAKRGFILLRTSSHVGHF